MKCKGNPIASVMLAFSMLTLSSCGIQGVTEQTRDQVIQTNAKEAQLLDKTSDLDDKTSQLIAQTQSLNALTQQLVNQMGVTNDGVHLQILTLSLQSLTNPANTAVLNPPSLMLPYAEKFAETATPDELLQVVYTYILDAQQGATATDMRYHDRYVSLQAAAAIAAFAPQDKVAAIFQTQVTGAGRYIDASYELGAARYNFIEEWLFDVITDASQTPSANVAILQQAAAYYSQMKYLATSPFVAHLQVHAPQVLPGDQAGQYNDITWSVSLSDLQGQGRHAYNRFTDPHSGMSATDLKNPQVQQLLQSFLN